MSLLRFSPDVSYLDYPISLFLDSSEGANSQATLNGWQLGPSTSTNPAFGSLSHNVVDFLHQNGQAFSPKPHNSSTLTLPNSIIQLSNLSSDHRGFSQSGVSDQVSSRFNSNNVGQFAFQTLFLNGETQQSEVKQENGQENQRYYQSNSKRTRRYSHHTNNEQSTTSSDTFGVIPHHNRHKYLPKGTPTLQQVCSA